MDQRSGLPTPDVLQMPLRDVARGLKEAAHMTEDALAPIVAALPEPVQSALSEAMSTIKSQGKSVIALNVTLDDIATASWFVAGRAPIKSDAALFAKVISFAWDHLKSGDLVSETILASHLNHVRLDGLDAEEHAALLVREMAKSLAFGKMPGLPVPEEVDKQTEVMVALIAPTVWLLAEREQSVEEELRLLDLSSALARAFDADIRSALADDAALAPLLKTLACHL